MGRPKKNAKTKSRSVRSNTKKKHVADTISSSHPNGSPPRTPPRRSCAACDESMLNYGPLTLKSYIDEVFRLPKKGQLLFASASQEEEEFNNYLSFLTVVLNNETSPWTESELASEYYASRTNSSYIIEYLPGKIVEFHRKIRSTELEMALKIKLVFLTQSVVYQKFLSEVRKYDKCTIVDRNRRIILFRGEPSKLGQELYLERENEEDTKQNKGLNPFPWGLDELSHLMECVLFETDDAHDYLNLLDVSRDYQTLTGSRRSVEQLAAKITQYLQICIPKYADQPDTLRSIMRAIYTLQLKADRERLYELKGKIIYQQNEDGILTSMRHSEFKLGKFNARCPLNMNTLFSSLLFYVQRQSVKSITNLPVNTVLRAFGSARKIDPESQVMNFLRVYMREIPYLVELDARTGLFDQLHTVFLARTKVNPVFLKASSAYHKNRIQNGVIMEYEANNVLIQFDVCKGSKMQLTSDENDHSPKKNSSTKNSQSPKNLTILAMNMLDFLISLLEITIQPMTDEEIYKRYQAANPGLLLTHTKFFSTLSSLKQLLESCLQLDLFTRLRLIFLTSTPISDAFEAGAREYEIVADTKGTLLKFSAVVNLKMSLDEMNQPFGIMTDVTLFVRDANWSDPDL